MAIRLTWGGRPEGSQGGGPTSGAPRPRPPTLGRQLRGVGPPRTWARAARAVKATAAKVLVGRQASRPSGLRERARTWGLGPSIESGVEGAGEKRCLGRASYSVHGCFCKLWCELLSDSCIAVLAWFREVGEYALV